MPISRIDKMIHERIGAENQELGKSGERRNLPFQIIMEAEVREKTAVMCHAAVSLALRSFNGPIPIHGLNENAVALGLYEGITNLRDELKEVARLYGAPDRLEFRSDSPKENLPSLRLGNAQGPGLIADAAGWVAGINQSLPEGAPAEVPACLFAVACAFTRIFASTVLGAKDKNTSWLFDVMNLETVKEAPANCTSTAINFGRMGILGAGAIGNAVAYGLFLSRWKGIVDVIDYDLYEEPNNETSLLIGIPDVLAAHPKAKRLAEIISRGDIQAIPHEKEINAESSELRIRRDVFICGVDNSPTRRELDHAASDLILNAGVGGTALDAGHVLLSIHGADDPLLSTLYAEDPPKRVTTGKEKAYPADFSDECSRLSYDSASLAAPFIALASGALLLACCAGHALKNESKRNYLKVDLLGFQSAIGERFRVMQNDVATTKNRTEIGDATPLSPQGNV